MIPPIPPEFSTALAAGLKIFSLLGLLVYVGFAAVMVRQEQLMSKVLESTPEGILRLLVSIHLIAALLLFGLAFILL